MFISALFMVAKIVKCSIDDWIKKIWYMYTMDNLLLSHKKE